MPTALGVNAITIVQLSPVAIVELHELVELKALALAPLIVVPANVSAAVPVLVSVTVCIPLVGPTSWLPNATEDLLKLSCAAPG